MWNFRLPPKIKNFFWQVFVGCLPTTNNLKSRMVDCNVSCGLCGGEDESLFHIFISCPEAKEAWRAVQWKWSTPMESSFSRQLQREFRSKRKEDLSRLIWGCWGIWCERNQRLWQGVYTEANFILQKTKIFVSGWEQAHQVSSKQRGRLLQEGPGWNCPKPGRLKLNVDAAVRVDRCGLGWILRNENGDFVAGVSMPWQGKLSPLEAELIGIREALSWTFEQGWNAVDVESDASRAISEIQQGSSTSTVGLLAGDMNEKGTSFIDISFTHIRRSANRPAHELDQAACSLSECCIWVSNP
ncbi:unnamed protein product, partial [Cuscuta epithymum]